MTIVETDIDTAAYIVESELVSAVDLMTRPVTTLPAGVGLHHVARTLRETGHATIAVVDDDGYLINLVTEDSVAAAYLAHLRADTPDARSGALPADLTTTVPDFLLPPHAVELNTTPARIIEIMLGSRLRSLPVVHHVRPVGMVAWHDILTATPDRPPPQG